MADSKKSVILYCDLIHTIEKMDNETAGEFFKHYLRYVNDLKPKTENLLVELTFESVKQNLKRDLNRWDSIKLKRVEAGRIGGKKRAERFKQNQANVASAKILKQNQANQAVNGNVNVNDNVNVINNKDEYASNGFSFRKSLCDLGIKKELVNDFLKNRKLKRLANTETAFRNLKIEFEKTGKDLNDLIEIIISNGWGGFKNSWLENQKEKSSAKKEKVGVAEHGMDSHNKALEQLKKDYGISD